MNATGASEACSRREPDMRPSHVVAFLHASEAKEPFSSQCLKEGTGTS